MTKMIVVEVEPASKIPMQAFVKSVDASAFAKEQKALGWDSEVKTVKVKDLKKKELMVALFNRVDWKESDLAARAIAGAVSVKKARAKADAEKIAKGKILPPLNEVQAP